LVEKRIGIGIDCGQQRWFFGNGVEFEKALEPGQAIFLVWLDADEAEGEFSGSHGGLSLFSATPLQFCSNVGQDPGGRVLNRLPFCFLLF
jgi:hypothetical protein